MPFFSFILKKKYTTSQLGILDANLKTLIARKKYFSKNTNVWKLLNKKNNNIDIQKISYESHDLKIAHAKTILFCLPPSIGIGDSIEYALAIKAIENKKIFKKIGIAFCSRSHKIISQIISSKNIYSDFISDEDMQNYEKIFHFSSEINSLKLQKYQRENIEEKITKFFNVEKYRPRVKNNEKKISRISIFPISNSPIRTLSVLLVNDIIKFLYNKKFKIDLILGYNDIISNTFKKKLESNCVNILIPKNINDLDNYIKNIEFGIFCDSGPLHLSKLYKKKGFLISTSVDSKKILSKQDNIFSYNSIFNSPYCSAPCGLTNIINFKNNHGCFNSLKKTKEYILDKSDLSTLNRGNLKNSYKFFMETPVACVKSIKFEKIKKLLEQLIN